MDKQRIKDNNSVYRSNIEANQFYDKLTSMMSELAHEIRNIITPVNITLQLLLKNLSESEKNRDYLEHAIGQMVRLFDLLDGVKDFSNKSKIEKKDVFLKEIVNDVFVKNLKLLETKNVIFINEIEDSVKVLIDEGAFNQVLYNLFQNTINCLTDSGAGMIRINVEEIDEHYVKLIYRNNGPQIPVDLLEKIFLPHFSTNGRKRGLGLGISLKLMTRMGGTIRAEVPEKGWGCRFVLLVPVSENRKDNFDC